ncbi:aminopeptidase [Chloroflexota bacterium]
MAREDAKMANPIQMADVLSFARIPVRLNVNKGENVLILTDTNVERVVYESLVAAVSEMEAVPVLLIIPPPAAFGHEPQEIAAVAISRADTLIAACSVSVTHTDAVREGLAAGVKYVAMGGVDSDILTHGAATADYDEVQQITGRLIEIMSKGNRVRVTSTQGSDITFSIKGRKGHPLDAIFRPGTIACFPDGEAAWAPVEGTAQGLLIVDTSMHHIGKCHSPIRLTVKDGKVVNIEGENEADQLKKLLQDKGDDNSYNIGEFAIGTNPKARCTGNPQEDKKTLGSVHIAIGDSRSLGGTVSSRTHLDGIILRPTVYIDGKMITDNGKMLIDLKK